MIVGFIPYRPSLHTGNLLWLGKFPIARGVFPPTHPVAPRSSVGEAGSGQYGSSPALDAFRAAGWWASCFPEGDGITWQPWQPPVDWSPLTDELAALNLRALADARACWPTWDLLDEAAFRPTLTLWQRQEGERERQRRRAFIESRERQKTGLCSKILRFDLFCALPIGHEDKCSYLPVTAPATATRVCCGRCGSWIVKGIAHECGKGVHL